MGATKPNLDDLRIEREPERSSPRLPLTVVGAVIVLAMLAAGLWFFTRSRGIEVRTAVVRAAASGPAERTVLNASGYVTARRQATVSAKVTGKVVEVLIEEGTNVQEGQVLARLDDTNVKASLNLAEAQLESTRRALEETRVRLKQAGLDLQRINDLAKSSISAQQELEHAEADEKALTAKLNQQEADVTVAEKQVASWQQQLDDTIIRAPFSGIVTTKDAQPGEMISPISAGGGFTRTGIGTIVDMSSLEIEIDVNESYINRVESGQPVEATLDAYPDWKIPCKVIAIIPTADRQKSTVKVRVGFDKLDTRILPEMSVKVAFKETAVPGAPVVARNVIVPKAAVQQQDGRDIVLVVQNGRAERRAVTVSDTRNDETIVSSGLAAGERVALDWPQKLADGTAVKEVR
jgi:RND family efflux transporter MFP subunit